MGCDHGEANVSAASVLNKVLTAKNIWRGLIKNQRQLKEEE